MKSLVENRGRWDAGFRSPLLRCLLMFISEIMFAVRQIVEGHSSP